MTGVSILGRTQAKIMNYISYPEVHALQEQEQSPVSQDSLKSTDCIHSLKPMQCSLQSKKTAQFTDYPQSQLDCTGRAQSGNQGKIKYCKWAKVSTSFLVQEFNNYKWKDSAFAHTKDYILHEYADVFKGVGILTGSPYHIKLKDCYKPVQHPPRSVPLGMHSAYKAELDRPVKEVIITKVHEHTDWINSVVPVMKEDGSLDCAWIQKTWTKESKEINGMQEHYLRILRTSGFRHMVLDFRSSLMTTFNTPWGIYRWLRMPFGLKVSSDVFQDRMDRVLRLVPGVLWITDDIVIHGATENTHDGTVLVLCETARLNNLSLNSKKMQFKSTDCKYFWAQTDPR